MAQRTNQNVKAHYYDPAIKHPTERRVLEKRCRTCPSDRSSEELRIKTEFEGQVRGGVLRQILLGRYHGHGQVTVTDTQQGHLSTIRAAGP